MRFVVVGSGNMAGTYVRVLDALPEAELVGIVSRSGRRPETPSGLPLIEVASALDRIESPFDAVILATPNGVHHRDAVEAARLGKHVLTEKVLDVTRENMDRMIEACRAAGVRLGTVFQRRTSPDNVAVKRMLEAGELGRVFAADLSVKCWRGQDYYDSAGYRGTIGIDGGGPFMQQAAHQIDLYVWFFGMPDRVEAMTGTLCHEMEGEDHGAAVLRHADGMIGTIVASTAAKPGFPARFEIHAEAGSVVLENDRITNWAVEGRPSPASGSGEAIHDGATSVAVEETSGHRALVRDFIQSIREGRDPLVSGEEARLATELILRIYKRR